MVEHVESSDSGLINLLRREADGLRIADIAQRMAVTATAVRQRLNRLMMAGDVERVAARAAEAGRGRPHHVYRLTDQGRQADGSNLADLALALWDEIRSIADVEVRRGLLARLSGRLAGFYLAHVDGDTPREKMDSLASFLTQRDIPFAVETKNELPVLKAYACPYTELAEQDRSVCAMESMLFTELIGERLQLSRCRLDGETCCTFELS